MRVQQLYIDDKIVPAFVQFPLDVSMKFFDFYGTNDLGQPSIVDTCGHGPAILTYNDTHDPKTDRGERILKRMWRGEDTCGNRVERTQTITLVGSPMFWNFKDYSTFSFSHGYLKNTNIQGQLGIQDAINLNLSQIDSSCTKSKYAIVSSGNILMEDTIVNGPVKTLKSDANFFSQALNEASKLSLFLNNTMRYINIGPKRIVCSEQTKNTLKEFPIENFLNASCVQHKEKQFYTNIIEEDEDVERPNADNHKIVLKGDELVYNVFYFKVSNKSFFISLKNYLK